MKITEMSNEQLAEKLCKADYKLDSPEAAELFVTIKYKLCPVKSIYYVRYKWSTNNRDWLEMVPTKVMADSHKQAAQTMKDANTGLFTGDVLFMAGPIENAAGLIYSLSDLQ